MKAQKDYISFKAKFKHNSFTRGKTWQIQPAVQPLFFRLSFFMTMAGPLYSGKMGDMLWLFPLAIISYCYRLTSKYY
jgi:hypothetical protein